MNVRQLPLIENCVVRTARKPWRCVGARQVSWWGVRRTCEHGWTESRYGTADEAQAALERLRGAPCHGGMVPEVDDLQTIAYPNPEYRPDCLVDIAPGDTYVEYRGEVAAFWESGTRFCVRCAAQNLVADR